MTAYTQQANILMERLPESDQQFIVEFIKKISLHTPHNAEKKLDGTPSNSKKAIQEFIRGINAATDEVLDDEFDAIVNNRINITRELDL